MNIKPIFYSIFVLLVMGLCVNTQAQPSSTKISTGFHNPLVDAADRGDEGEVARLLQEGVPVDSRGDFGMTPLMRAAFKGKADIVTMLLQAGADVDAVDLGGASAMHMAVKQGNADIIKLLFKADAMVDIPDDEGWTPLMRASIAKKTSVIPVLLANGASITKTNNAGHDALTLAVQSGDTTTMGLLADSAGFESLPSGEANKLLKLANQKNNQPMVALLTEHLGGEEVKDNDKVLVAQAAPVPAPAAATTSKPAPVAAPAQVAQAAPTSAIVTAAPKAAPVQVAKQVAPAVTPKAATVAQGPAIALAQPLAPKPIAPKPAATPIISVATPVLVASAEEQPAAKSPLVETLLTPLKVLAAMSSSASGNDGLISSANAAEAPAEPVAQSSSTPAPVAAVTVVNNDAPLPWLADKPKTAPAESVKVAAGDKPAPAKSQETVVSDAAPLPWLKKKTDAPAPAAASSPAGEKGKRVEVAEAIRVPLADTSAPAGKPIRVRQATGYSPSNSKSIKNSLWLQVGPYASESEALSHYDTVKENPMFDGMRVRVISAVSSYNEPGTSLWIGPVEEEDASSLCGLMVKDGIGCSIVKDTGRSTSLSRTRGAIDNDVAPENRRTGNSGTGRYWVQLGTFETEDEAVAQRNRLKSRYSALFNPLSFTISAPRSGSNQQGAFRLRAGSFMSSDDAANFCTKLSGLGVECISVRN